jgi:hypothetical protein
MIFFCGIGIIGLGLLSIYGKDLMWEFTEYQNRMKGVASERTPEWETGTTIGGIIAIVFGVIAILAGFSN